MDQYQDDEDVLQLLEDLDVSLIAEAINETFRPPTPEPTPSPPVPIRRSSRVKVTRVLWDYKAETSRKPKG